jgi:EmrB/QacA subfamily drug resistance transporter
MKLEYRWWVALVVALGAFLSVLDTTIVNVALPYMQRAFHTDFETITWVVTGYFLAQAVVVPVTGYFSDLLTTKFVFLTSLALFTIGSACCALAPTIELLIGARVLQGIGGGALLPTTYAIIFRLFAPVERGAVTAVIGIPLVLAPAFGPTLGGYLATTFGWRAIFTINLPIGIVALLLVLLVLRGRSYEETQEREQGSQMRRTKQRFDLLGLGLPMTGFAALIFGMTEAGFRGWSDALVMGFLLGGAALLGVFIAVELRVSAPVLDVRLFRSWTFSISNLLLWAFAATFFGSLFLLLLFFENVQGQLALTTGELVISQGIATAVSMIISGKLYNRVGPRLLTTVGFALLTISSVGFWTPRPQVRRFRLVLE